MGLTLLTATGNRNDAFSLCLDWMLRQSLKANFWIVVDDGKPNEGAFYAMMAWKEIIVIHPTPHWKPGQNTQRRNLLAGLQYYEGGALAIIEDDDFYHPDYLQVMMDKLNEGYDIVGSERAVYYYLPAKEFRHVRNINHSALCNTVMNEKGVELFKKVLLGNEKCIDGALWNLVHLSDVKSFLFPKAEYVVGMKGLPGRPGIGQGQAQFAHLYRWNKDPELRKLKKLIGEEDTEVYKRLFTDLGIWT